MSNVAVRPLRASKANFENYCRYICNAYFGSLAGESPSWPGHGSALKIPEWGGIELARQIPHPNPTGYDEQNYPGTTMRVFMETVDSVVRPALFAMRMLPEVARGLRTLDSLIVGRDKDNTMPYGWLTPVRTPKLEVQRQYVEGSVKLLGTYLQLGDDLPS